MGDVALEFMEGLGSGDGLKVGRRAGPEQAFWIQYTKKSRSLFWANSRKLLVDATRAHGIVTGHGKISANSCPRQAPPSAGCGCPQSGFVGESLSLSQR